MLLANLPVVLVDTVLHKVEYQGCVEVGTPRSIPYPDRHGEIALHQRVKHWALLFKHFAVPERFLRLDEELAGPSSGVRLGCWLTENGELNC